MTLNTTVDGTVLPSPGTYPTDLAHFEHPVTGKVLAYLGDEFNSGIVAVTALLCAAAVIPNLGIMTYYWPRIKSSESSTPFLYFILSCSDFVIGICAGMHSIIFAILLALKSSGFDSIFWLVLCCYFLTVGAFKVSAFVSMIFAVIRTIQIVSPFTKIRKKLATLTIFAWFVIWLVVSCAEIGLVVTTALAVKDASDTEGINFDSEYVLNGYFYEHNTGKFFQEFSSFNSANNCLVDTVYTASPVFLCAVITLLATIVQVVFLLKTDGTENDDPEGDRGVMEVKKKISVTIILISTLFVACSACTLYQPVVQACYRYRSKRHYHSLYVASNIPFFLNAALNPLILVLRGSRLRVHMRNLLTCNRN